MNTAVTGCLFASLFSAYKYISVCFQLNEEVRLNCPTCHFHFLSAHFQDMTAPISCVLSSPFKSDVFCHVPFIMDHLSCRTKLNSSEHNEHIQNKTVKYISTTFSKKAQCQHTHSLSLILTACMFHVIYYKKLARYTDTQPPLPILLGSVPSVRLEFVYRSIPKLS
jgi:hypothetical protein